MCSQIFLTVAEPVNQKYVNVFKKVAKDLTREYGCDVIIRRTNNEVLYVEVCNGKEKEKGRQLDAN